MTRGLPTYCFSKRWLLTRPTTTTQTIGRRVNACYKDALLDPVNNPASGALYNPLLTTVAFRSSPVNRPEQQLVGIMYDDYFDAEAPAQAYVVQNSGNWVYAGTGFKRNSSIP